MNGLTQQIKADSRLRQFATSSWPIVSSFSLESELANDSDDDTYVVIGVSQKNWVAGCTVIASSYCVPLNSLSHHSGGETVATLAGASKSHGIWIVGTGRLPDLSQFGCSDYKVFEFNSTTLVSSETKIAPNEVEIVGASPSSRFDAIVSDLGRMRDGWLTTESKAPLPEVVRDADLALRLLPSYVRTPEVEIDDSTGFVTLRWFGPRNENSFSITVKGNNFAIGVLSSLGDNDYQPWRLPLLQDARIASKLEDNAAREIISVS